MEAFAARAGRELLATGETARSVLNAPEAQIARLARDGLSTAEIGARMFVSPRTVQYHLQGVFAKLGIDTDSLPDDPSSFLSVEIRREITARTD
jgi:DNA-binding CsgD family transcriptional regulator